VVPLTQVIVKEVYYEKTFAGASFKTSKESEFIRIECVKNAIKLLINLEESALLSPKAI